MPLNSTHASRLHARFDASKVYFAGLRAGLDSAGLAEMWGTWLRFVRLSCATAIGHHQEMSPSGGESGISSAWHDSRGDCNSCVQGGEADCTQFSTN